MGEVIRRTAAREDILKDFKETYDKAIARKGIAAELADKRIGPILKIVGNIKDNLVQIQTVLGPLLAALDAADIHADKTIGKVSDDIWNDLGRPASDAAFDILFPGGNAFYVDGAVDEQPDRMDLLVELLKANVHPKISDGVTQASIATIEAESLALRQAAEAARPMRTRRELFDRVLTAVTRSAAIELANFKRLLKANGFSEADAHTIIPDRSSTTAPKAVVPPPVEPPATPG